MDQKETIQQMIKFNRTLFENSFDATVQFQDQMEKMGDTFLAQFGEVPDTGKQAYANCMEAFKEARNNYKNYMEEGYQQAEAFFS